LIHNTVENFISKNKIIPVVLDRYKECKAPLKSGKIGHLILDWTAAFTEEREISIKENAHLVLKALRNKTSGAPRKYIDNTIEVINEIHK